MTTKYTSASTSGPGELAADVRCAAVHLSDRDALARVHGGNKSLWRGRYESATLWYKPLWHVEATLRGRLPGSASEQVVAVVDGLTGIARCRRSGSPGADMATQPAERERFVATIVDASGALEAAHRTMHRMARRRRQQIDVLGEPLLFYKPVWLIARRAGGAASYAVDAQSGVLARVLS